jgi:hypothetical protein
MKRNMAVVGFVVHLAVMSCAGIVRATDGDEFPSQTVSANEQEVIVQIGGRMCEYRRSEVRQALDRFPEIQAVDFLNQHGTVLVRYRTGSTQPEAFADAVERALAMGWGCKAWVDRGG